MLAQIASERLVIVIITDLEWTDADSVAELDRMFRGEGAPRVLLVGTREVTEGALGEDLRRIGFPTKTSALRLSPLDDAEANALAERLHPDLDPVLRRQFVRAAGGQPGTLVDMLHFARRTDGDRARTLSELVARRLAALGEAARALVELTAIAGFPLRESLAAGTLGISQEAVRIAASELVTERMARLERRRGSTHLECASALVRNVVLDTLDAEAQRALRVALVDSLSRDRKSVERPELAVAHLVALGRSRLRPTKRRRCSRSSARPSSTSRRSASRASMSNDVVACTNARGAVTHGRGVCPRPRARSLRQRGSRPSASSARSCSHARGRSTPAHTTPIA